MSLKKQLSEPAAAIYAEASEWLVEVRAGDLDPGGQERFGIWLRRSPDHVRAYMELAALWGDIPNLTADMAIDAEAVVARARAQSNVTRLGVRAEEASDQGSSSDGLSASPGVEREIRRRRQRLAGMAIAAVLTCAAVGVGLWLYLAGETVTTTVGEDRHLSLADGTEVELGPGTQLRIKLTSRERRVVLLAGQALFRVARDGARPFLVASQNAEIRVLGTQFDVQQRPSGTTVTVLEGRVAVAADAHEPELQRVLLAAGEQLVVPIAAADAPHPRPVDPKAASIWTERTLNFEDTTLEDVVEEFNRYNEQQIVLETPELRAVRVSGVFAATKPQSLLNFLRAEIQLDIRESARQVRIRARTEK